MEAQSEILGARSHTSIKPILELRPLAALNLRHGATVAQVVEQLRTDILEGRIQPGARLIEAHLTERFAVSRGPVREAFRRLQAEGLIELPQNRGAFVKRLTARDVAEVFEIRAELEALAARGAAANARRGSHGKARLTMRSAGRAAERSADPTVCLKENERFHAAVFELAGNRNLETLCRHIHLPFVVSRIHLLLSENELRERMLDHVAIGEAILAGDEASAAAAMHAHIERTAANALARLEGVEASAD